MRDERKKMRGQEKENHSFLNPLSIFPRILPLIYLFFSIVLSHFQFIPPRFTRNGRKGKKREKHFVHFVHPNFQFQFPMFKHQKTFVEEKKAHTTCWSVSNLQFTVDNSKSRQRKLNVECWILTVELSSSWWHFLNVDAAANAVRRMFQFLQFCFCPCASCFLFLLLRLCLVSWMIWVFEWSTDDFSDIFKQIVNLCVCF